MAQLDTIRDNLATELAAVVTSGELANVQHGRSIVSTGMPYARYYFDGWEDDPLTTGAGDIKDWDDTFRYKIDIIGDFASAKTITDQEEDFYKAVDAVKRRLQENSNLGDNDDLIMGMTAQTSEMEAGDGRILICEIILRVRTINSY